MAKASHCEVELSRNRFTDQEAFVSHAKVMVSVPTARKWAARFRAEGAAGMQDRSSRPRSCPHRTPERVVRQIVHLRWRHRLGPIQIGGRLGLPASTVHAVLVGCHINRLSHIDRVTGEPIRRYEHPHPGALIHVDVTKLGNIPDGGGHRFLSRLESDHNAQATARRTGERGKHCKPVIGTAFVHTVVDDHSRIAYAEICADERATTAVQVLQRAVAWFAERGVSVERVLSDNGSAYRSHLWREACAELRLTHKRTRHRIHSAIGGTPFSRLNNLPGHHIYRTTLDVGLEESLTPDDSDR